MDVSELKKYLTVDDLKCPYISKEMAAFLHTKYYCTFDHMEFESFLAHCEHCEMFANLMKRGLEIYKCQADS